MRREEIEKEASKHIEKTYNEHSWEKSHKTLIKIMCDFAESQKMYSEKDMDKSYDKGFKDGVKSTQWNLCEECQEVVCECETTKEDNGKAM